MEDMKRMSVLFCGHGSPTNAIDPNSRARAGWSEVGRRLVKPRVIVAISAHWATNGTKVRRSDINPQINDMYGFPDELYQVHYEPVGCVEMSDRVLELLGDSAEEDNDWGIDHGVWSVLCNVYPQADVPVVMVSTDELAASEHAFELGRQLRPLRDEGAMIFASGNVVHNLRKVKWNMDCGQPWADAFDNAIRDAILARDFSTPVSFDQLPDYRKSVPTPDHYLPLLVALGAVHDDDRIEAFNDYRELGSMSMTSYLFEA